MTSCIKYPSAPSAIRFQRHYEAPVEWRDPPRTVYAIPVRSRSPPAGTQWGTLVCLVLQLRKCFPFFRCQFLEALKPKLWLGNELRPVFLRITYSFAQYILIILIDLLEEDKKKKAAMRGFFFLPIHVCVYTVKWAPRVAAINILVGLSGNYLFFLLLLLFWRERTRQSMSISIY